MMNVTTTVLEVPAVVYAAVKALMMRAGREDAINDTTARIDMQGIALTVKAGTDLAAEITIGTLLSSLTHEGRIEFAVNAEIVQMDLTKAREVVGMFHEAIEAAVSDELIHKFLTQRLGLDPSRAAMALLDFRELRQGSVDSVHPS
jgi:hypothetical protein